MLGRCETAVGFLPLLSAVILLAVPGEALPATRLVPQGFPTIQAAIDVSTPGDTVLIAPGIYRGPGNRDIELRGRDVVVTSIAGAAETILDLERMGRGFYIHEGETRTARIEGLTIRNGNAPEDPVDGGGGIYIELSSPTISQCWILDCNAEFGAGLFLGAFYGVLENCWIGGNVSPGGRGGGILYLIGHSDIRDCLITGNRAMEGAGVAFMGGGANRLTGCTIAGNWGTYGGGIYAGNPFFLERCIVWGNCAVSDGDEIYSGHPGDIRCSAINRSGVHNWTHNFIYDEYCVFADPRFCDAAPCGLHTQGDWTLSGDSPCLPGASPCGMLIGALGQGCGWSGETGACCLPDGSCVMLPEDECLAASGVYLGNGTPCAPGACDPVRVETKTWGRIKAAFRP